MHVRNPIPLVFLLALALGTLTGCHNDCDCCRDSTVVTEAVPMKPAPRAEKPTTGTTQARVESAAPRVAGKWIGTWESIGHKGHGGGLRCEATEAGPGKWEAVFTAEYGPTKSYNVKLEGKLAGGAVLFGGKVDLGKGDGGVFTWSGEATQTAFKGKYEGGGDTGSFQMVRAPN